MSKSDSQWSALLESALGALLDSSEEGIFVFDADAICRMASRRAGEFFGRHPRTLVGKPSTEVLSTLSLACEEPEAFLIAAHDPSFADPPRMSPHIEIRSPRRLLLWGSFPIVRDNIAIGRLVLVHDVTRERNSERARRHLLARIEQLTTIDALTGLSNRRHFLVDLEREHGRAMRAWDSYAVLRIDIDAMHSVNEHYGPPIGDRVLERVAELIRAGRRQYDIVARMENDEFAVLLPGADIVAGRTVALRITSAVSQQTVQATDGPPVTVSIGGAVCVPPTGESAEDVLRRAGLALIAARSKGNSEVEVDAPAEYADRVPQL